MTDTLDDRSVPTVGMNDKPDEPLDPPPREPPRQTRPSSAVLFKDKLAFQLSDFQAMLKFGCCVDKTPIIETFLLEPLPIHLVLRPRQCGKTTLLTMFRAFFEWEDAEAVKERKKLFLDAPLAISMSPLFDEYFAQHPVVHIDLVSVRGQSFKEMRARFNGIVLAEYLRQQDLGRFKNLDSVSERLVREVLDGSNISARSFQTLALILKRVTKKNVILLIDEYDGPIFSGSQWGYLAEAVEFFQSVYTMLLKGNIRFVHGTLMAGIMRSQQTGFLSGVNNLLTFSLDPSCNTPLDRAYARSLLFTEEEVIALFDYYNAKEEFAFGIEDLKDWYGGYFAAGDVELFNPWSVCRALDSHSLKGYWTASAVDNFILRHISKTPNFHKTLALLMEGKGVAMPTTNPKVGIDEDMDEEDILDTLLYAGYLSKRGNVVKIPNIELHDNFFTWASKTLSKDAKDATIYKHAGELFNACMYSPPYQFKKLLRDYIEKYAPPSFGRSEASYQNYIYGVFQHAADDRFAVHAESNGGLGRMDMYVEEVGGTHAVIVEFKASRGTCAKKDVDPGLAGLAHKALKQIDERKYRLRLPDGIVQLREYGIAFHHKNCEIRERFMKRNPGKEWVIYH